LKSIDEEYNTSWSKDQKYLHIWRAKYTEMLDYYVDIVNKYTQVYMKSPAGVAFHGQAAKCRKKKKSLPILDENTLREFEGEKGMSWGIAQVWDFWRILGTVSMSDPVMVSVILSSGSANHV
jgi:hypothetical protein